MTHQEAANAHERAVQAWQIAAGRGDRFTMMDAMKKAQQATTKANDATYAAPKTEATWDAAQDAMRATTETFPRMATIAEAHERAANAHRQTAYQEILGKARNLALFNGTTIEEANVLAEEMAECQTKEQAQEALDAERQRDDAELESLVTNSSFHTQQLDAGELRERVSEDIAQICRLLSPQDPMAMFYDVMNDANSDARARLSTTEMWATPTADTKLTEVEWDSAMEMVEDWSSKEWLRAMSPQWIREMLNAAPKTSTNTD